MLTTGKKLNRLKKSITLLGFIREKRTQSKLLPLRLEREREANAGHLGLPEQRLRSRKWCRKENLNCN